MQALMENTPIVIRHSHKTNHTQKSWEARITWLIKGYLCQLQICGPFDAVDHSTEYFIDVSRPSTCVLVGNLGQPHSGRQAAVSAAFRGLLQSFASNVSVVAHSQQWFENKIIDCTLWTLMCTKQTGALPIAVDSRGTRAANTWFKAHLPA